MVTSDCGHASPRLLFNMKRSFLFAGLIAFIVSVLVAAPERVIERVQSTGGKVVIWPGGGVLAAPDKINLPFGIVVETNGTFTVKGGKVRTLEEGDVLGADGRLIRPDGSRSEERRVGKECRSRW